MSHHTAVHQASACLTGLGRARGRARVRVCCGVLRWVGVWCPERSNHHTWRSMNNAVYGVDTPYNVIAGEHEHEHEHEQCVTARCATREQRARKPTCR